MANERTAKHGDMYGANLKYLTYNGESVNVAMVDRVFARACTKEKVKKVWWVPETAGTTPVCNIRLKNGANVVATVAKTSGTFTAGTPVELTIDSAYEDFAVGDKYALDISGVSGTIPKGTLQVAFVQQDAE